jgi:hypothetical protein
MQLAWRYPFWRSVIICLGGALGIVLLAYGCFIARFDFAKAGFVLLILITFSSLVARFSSLSCFPSLPSSASTTSLSRRYSRSGSAAETIRWRWPRSSPPR